VLFDSGDAEIVRHAACRYDENVVRDLTVLGPHCFLVDSDLLDFGPQETEAGLRERNAKRIRDGVRRQLAGGDLVEERSKE